jgi:hypothetical protein
MSYERSGKGRSRAVYYQLYARPVEIKTKQSHVGWFGKFFLLTMLVTFLGFGYSARSTLLGSYAPHLYLGSSAPAEKVMTEQKQVTAKPAPAKSIVDLQQSLDKWGKEHSEQRWSVIVKSLDGPTFEAKLNADEVHSPDGIYKLFSVLPLFTQMTYDKQQQTMVTINGAKRPVSKCVDLMLRISDNNCGLEVGKHINVYKANTQFKQAGLAHTSYSGTASSIKTTATDTAMLMAYINGSMLNANAQKMVMDALNNQIFRSGLPAGCPGCVMADSSGFSATGVYDAAIVNYSQGKYVIAAFAEDGGFEEMAGLGGIVHQRVLDSIR